MALDLDIFEADRQAVIADIPVTVTFGDDEVTCRKSIMQLTDQGAVAGLLEDYVFSLHSIISEWDTLPEMGDLLTVDGEEYRVLRIVNDPVGKRLDMGAKYARQTL